MARSDARMKMLDAVLVLARETGTDEVFGGDVTAWCEANNIARRTFYRHKQRIDTDGRWEPRSRRPRSSPRHTPPQVEDHIEALRRSLGRDNGADCIAYHLKPIAVREEWESKGWTIPSRATINNILKRRGLVVPEPHKRPKTRRRFSYARPRDCYQIDATQVKLSDGTTVVVFEVLDDCTRVLVASVVAAAETADGAIAAIRRAFDDFGVSAIVLSDNGTAFTSRWTKGGRSRFTRVVDAAGARLIHSSPYHPQTCGKVERHHRTFKEWLADRDPVADLAELQHRCDTYRRWYNTQRRHSVCNMPPQQAWDHADTYGGPNHLPVQHDATIHTPTVQTNGTISVAKTNIGIGRASAGQQITVIRAGDHVTAYTTTGTLLGHLQLVPDKRYQGRLHTAA